VQFRVGFSLDVVAQAQHRVTVLGEFNQPNNSRAGAGLGAEFTMSDIGKSGFYFAGRGSYSYQSDNNLDPGREAGFSTGLSGKEAQDGLAAGFGVGYKRGELGLGVDYAWRSMGMLEGTHILSFSVSW
jgi:hypothetical protein